ncbi:lysozyme inhibitor LprI family protein, partial [Burkholderia thailandensis]
CSLSIAVPPSTQAGSLKHETRSTYRQSRFGHVKQDCRYLTSNVVAVSSPDSAVEPADASSTVIAAGASIGDGASAAVSDTRVAPAGADVPTQEASSSFPVTPDAPVSNSQTIGGRRTYQTSFDCTRAVMSDEVAVCGDPGLAAMDVELAAYYSNYLSRSVDPQILIQSQRAWLQERTACGADLDCLRRGYGARIGQMRDMQP